MSRTTDYGQNFVEYTKNITYIYNNIFEFILNVQRPHYCTSNFCSFYINLMDKKHMSVAMF